MREDDRASFASHVQYISEKDVISLFDHPKAR